MSNEVLISPAELNRLRQTEPTVLIDTRDPIQFAEAHIAGAVNVRDVFTYLATSTSGGLATLREKFADAFGKAAGASPISAFEWRTSSACEDAVSARPSQNCAAWSAE